ncbi:hypothetical protein [Psychrobacillus phage Perkons]|nr:hypothetical protein [Psychrobacillus phage Perkons]
MKKVQVYISGNYEENKETRFNYNNRVRDIHFVELTKEQVINLTKQDIEDDLLISYPSELKL